MIVRKFPQWVKETLYTILETKSSAAVVDSRTLQFVMLSRFKCCIDIGKPRRTLVFIARRVYEFTLFGGEAHHIISFPCEKRFYVCDLHEVVLNRENGFARIVAVEHCTD